MAIRENVQELFFFPEIIPSNLSLQRLDDKAVKPIPGCVAIFICDVVYSYLRFSSYFEFFSNCFIALSKLRVTLNPFSHKSMVGCSKSISVRFGLPNFFLASTQPENRNEIRGTNQHTAHIADERGLSHLLWKKYKKILLNYLYL